MNRKSDIHIAVCVATVVFVLLVALAVREAETTAQATQAGVFQVDPFWPKTLPNRWVFGSVVGLAVDSRDHVWVVHRGKASMDPDLGAMMAYPPDAPRFGGQFYGVHNVALDSKGNMYTVETYSGARLQKFTYKGQAPVAKPEGAYN